MSELGPCAILVLAPFDRVGRAIDRVTGRTGFSHVCLELGLGDLRDPTCLEIDPQRGVELVERSSIVRQRQLVRIELPLRVAPYVRRRALPWIGRSYSYPAMLLQPTRLPVPGVYCSRVVAACLPDALRRQVGDSPTPADFLRFARSTEYAAR